MKLNKIQKQFLFDNCYVTAKVLDACEERGWQNFYLKCYDWKLEDIERREFGSRQYYGQLRLVDNGKSIMGAATKGEVDHDIMLIFQDNDYETLKTLK